MYKITYSEGVAADLKRIQRNRRSQVLDRIEVQLKEEPVRHSRNRKILIGFVPPWDHQQPVWEVRIGNYRVFYDVHEANETVIVRAVRYKPPHQTTEDIL